MHEDLTKGMAGLWGGKLGRGRGDPFSEFQDIREGVGVRPVGCDCGAGRPRNSHSQAVGRTAGSCQRAWGSASVKDGSSRDAARPYYSLPFKAQSPQEARVEAPPVAPTKAGSQGILLSLSKELSSVLTGKSSEEIQYGGHPNSLVF